MGSIFYYAYIFFQKHRWIGIILLIGIISGSGYLAKEIKFEENIFKTIPTLKNSETIDILFEENGLGNKVVFHLFQEDLAPAPDSLIAVCDRLIDTLQTSYPQQISNMRYQVSDQNINRYYDIFLQNLPLFLDSTNYDEITLRIADTSIENTIRKNFRLLSTPLSTGVKKMIVKDPLSFTPLALEKLNQLQFEDNFSIYNNHILTTDKSHLVFFIDLNKEGSETSDNAQFFSEMDEVILQLEDESGITIEYFGSPVVAVANARQIKQDIQVSVTIAMVLIVLLLLFFFKKIGRIIVIVLPGVLAAIVSIGIIAVIYPSISVIALGIGSVLLGITVDYSLHIITHFKNEKDIEKLLHDVSTPLILSSITTSLAFFSLLFLDSEVLSVLGVFAGISMLVAAMFALLILPHSLHHQEQSDHKQNFIENWVMALAHLRPENSKWTIIGTICVILICLFTWKDYQFEKDMMKINYMPKNLADKENRINEISNLSQKKFYLAVKDSTFDGALRKNTILKSTIDQLLADSTIVHARYINNLIPDKLTQQKNYEQYTQFWRKHKGDSVLAKTISAGEKSGFKAKAYGAFEQLLNMDYHPLDSQNISFFRNELFSDLIFESNGQFILLSQISATAENKQKAIEVFSDLTGVDILDKGHITSQLVSFLSDKFSTLVNISLLVVFGILLIVYGRIELALLAFIPVISSWVCTLGIMAIFGLKFNIVNIIISTFIFGLGIDYSIFMLRGLLQKYATNSDQLFSYKKSIILSSLTTLIGMGVLIFAKHPALESIALLAVTGILSVVIITFILQPWLFKLFIQKRKEHGKIPITLWLIFGSFNSFSMFLIGCLILNGFRMIFLIPIGNENRKKVIFHHVIRIFCWLILKTCFNLRIKNENFDKNSLKKPSIIIANHTSFVDILYVLSISHKVVIVTNEWVYKSPFFGRAVQYADFVRASLGLEEQLVQVKQLTQNGYSVVIFPEGTRSETGKIGRFHKGAFYLAESLQLDIYPLVLHGFHYVLPKKDTFIIKNGTSHAKYLDKISWNDPGFGKGYKERTKKISSYFKSCYEAYKQQKEVPGFFKDLIYKNYLYKGPILEWYLKVKFQLEKQYQTFHELVPESGKIIDLGCGYGFISFSLALASEKREILGIDYDESKIDVAQNIPTRCANLQFEQGDVTQFNAQDCDLILISDVLHYLTPEEQMQTLENCYHSLSDNGQLLIRDGDSNLTKRQKGTWLTEFFSTNIGFNKTRNKLNFISSDLIIEFAKKNNLQFQEIDQTKMTSNKIYRLTKNG